MRIIKIILFFLLLPVFAPLMLFVHLTYHGPKPEESWYDKLREEKGASKLLFILLTPIFLPVVGFLYLTQDWWQGLLDSD